MCLRYVIASKSGAIERELQAEFQYSFSPVFNAGFGMDLPVVLGGQEEKIVRRRWGLLPYWSRFPDFKYHHINAYAGEVVKSPVYRVPLRQRRCLVIANAWYCWIKERDNKKQPYLIYLAGQRIFTMAGLWDEWKDRERKQCIHTFSIITSHANKRLKCFSSSMPVIVPPGRRRKYLRKDVPLNEIMRMLRPFESDQFNLYPVGPFVNDLSLNDKCIVQPVGQRLYKEYEYVPRAYLKLEGMGGRKANPDRKPEIRQML